jgi:hypothetical protein
MDAASVFRILSLIPERSARAQSGAAFLVQAGSCTDPERLVPLSKCLHWLSPLDALTNDDQRALGLIGVNGKPLQAPDDADEAESEAEAAA